MDKQARQLAGLIENMMYYFGTQRWMVSAENLNHGSSAPSMLPSIKRAAPCSMPKRTTTKSGATRIVARLEDRAGVSRTGSK